MPSTSAVRCVVFSEEVFYAVLANEHCPPETVHSVHQAKELFAYLGKCGVLTIVIEDDYVDGDYMEDFASFHVRCFAQYRNRCRRLHFFRGDDKNVESLLNTALAGDTDKARREAEEQLQACYCGFCVTRPLPRAIIGRTVILPYPPATNGVQYRATRDYDANLFGIPLKIRGTLAFQQQDTVVAACATVSLWCAFQKLSVLFGISPLRPAKITQHASSLGGRPFPSTGLSVEEMCAAIVCAGLEPEVFDIAEKRKDDSELPEHLKKSNELRNMGIALGYVHGYLAMGLPVILCGKIDGLGRHAVTVVGFEMSGDILHHAHSDLPQTIASRICRLFVHDDQIAPFAAIEVASEVGSPIVTRGHWRNENDPTPFKLEAIVVPLYGKIRVKYEDIIRSVFPLDQILRSVFENLNDKEQKDYYWDIHLILVNEYKKQFRVGSKMQADVRREILTHQHPRFIWRASFRWKTKPILELLGDATDMAESCFYFVRWRDAGAQSSLKSRFAGLLGTAEAKSVPRYLLDLVYSSFTTGYAWKRLAEERLPGGPDR